MTTLVAQAEAARRLAISTRTLRRLLSRGELAAHRIGGQVRLAEDELERFIRGTRCLAEPIGRKPGHKAGAHHRPGHTPTGIPDFEKIRA